MINKEERFHQNRIAFAWLNGKWEYNEYDKRDHLHWLHEDFNISIKEYENIPRGYMIEDRIQLFIGSKFEEIDDNTLLLLNIKELLEKYKSVYDSNNINIFNGVIVGNIGDIWEPISIVKI